MRGKWEEDFYEKQLGIKSRLEYDLAKGMDINFLLVESVSNLGYIEKTGFGLEKCEFGFKIEEMEEEGSGSRWREKDLV